QPRLTFRSARWLSFTSAPTYGVSVKTLDERVIGYVALSPYRKGRRAFSHTCEISYYLFSGYRGRGFGKELVRTALSAAREAGFETAIAIILGCNLRSIRLLEGFGFSVCGTSPTRPAWMARGSTMSIWRLI
ncbi:MAG: hypothetical protein CGU29_11180, partial [Candidatus Dactylopiibacterium carminicum]